MSIPTPTRRRRMQRLALTGIGSAVLVLGSAPAAGAADGVVIPLAPSEIELGAYRVGSIGVLVPMGDLAARSSSTPVGVQHSGTITVDLPAELDDSAVQAELVYEPSAPGGPEVTYSSSLAPADPHHVVVTGRGTGSITITLPADDPMAGDVAYLFVEPLESELGPAFVSRNTLIHHLGFDSAAPAAQTVASELVAESTVPCAISSSTPCPFPTPVTAGSTVGLDLTAGSPLRELGITDLSGVRVGLASWDAHGHATGVPVELPVQASGSTASFVLPAGSYDAAASHEILIVQETPSGFSIVRVQITVEAATTTPAVVPPVNAGLRSNTGVEAGGSGSTGAVGVAAGAGMLLLAGAGGLVLARSRRRPATEGGTRGA